MAVEVPPRTLLPCLRARKAALRGVQLDMRGGALVLVGYGAMRFVDFHVVGAKCKAKKPLKDGAVEKKPSKCVIKKVVDGGKSFVVAFGKGGDTATLPKDKVFADGFAPPDWFKQAYNLVQVSE